MYSKSRYFFILFFSTLTLLGVELVYLQVYKTPSTKEIEMKNSFVKVSSLPDLAISTEAMYIRHRSLSDSFSIFKESPELREYFPTTFIYSHSNILNKTPQRISNEK